MSIPGLERGKSAGRTLASWVLSRRWLRLALIGLLVAIPLLIGGWLALRHSPLVAVRDVRVSGVHGPQASEIDAALTAAALSMSTLDVHPAALRAAVARFHVVSEVKAVASIPHGLHIEVSEQPAVAVLLVAGARTAVAANGVVLGSNLVTSSLPSIGGYALPEPGHRVQGPNVLAALAILGAAPAPLARHVTRVYAGAEGITVVMGNGLLAYFGDASRPHAKWLSLARVLADPSSAGASYVDVRLPARPAAGFPAGVTPPGATTTSGEASAAEVSGNSESTIAALAAGHEQPDRDGDRRSTDRSGERTVGAGGRRRRRTGDGRNAGGQRRNAGRWHDGRRLTTLNLGYRLSLAVADPQAVIESPAFCNESCETGRRR